jgi:hypothetical protein
MAKSALFPYRTQALDAARLAGPDGDELIGAA